VSLVVTAGNGVNIQGNLAVDYDGVNTEGDKGEKNKLHQSSVRGELYGRRGGSIRGIGGFGSGNSLVDHDDSSVFFFVISLSRVISYYSIFVVICQYFFTFFDRI
jgi:hypothetical protein